MHPAPLSARELNVSSSDRRTARTRAIEPSTTPPRPFRTTTTLRAGTLALLLPLLLGVGCAEKSRLASFDPAVPSEHRAVWVLNTLIEEGAPPIRQTLDGFRQANINVLCLLTQKRGYAMYPDSEWLPQLPTMGGRDPFPEFIREAHAMGMKVEAWTEYGFYTYHTPDASKDPSRGAWLDASPHLVSRNAEGQAAIHHETWGDFFALDPANPAAQELLANLYVETVRRYPFDGINLDRIRFANATHGYGESSRSRFRADTGLDLDEIAPGNEAWKRWREWRKTVLTEFMADLSRRLREARPGLRITMATVPPEMIEDMGQDWTTWLERGYVDAVYPMLYGPNPARRYAEVREITREHPNVYAGLDLEIGPEAFAKGVNAWRALGYRGIVVWHSDFLLEHREYLGREVFPARAASPLFD